ncbi:hypothetical protein AUK40_04250 [Candidatus Wirthbacteria bacterium CG2_30_54_11]|uniref:Uncharacterized protein n=1 Tax=Candidatus Wirthbacteria bacterium CG2_30_54_11 TaxID=1817892 RepID=A0A1J5IUY5_9BACT|nr:MAG: hypothetical protein AUK40_04250 [Candidatus Wirthbacteria bacterium CG2_30_54_11]
MKNRTAIIATISIGILAGLTFFILSQYHIEITSQDTGISDTGQTDDTRTPPVQTAQNCSLTPCHGLDISCELTDGPVACDMMYTIGDNCRQYASCEVTDGSCTLTTTSRFDSCKSCMERCQQSFGNDVTGLFECESLCVQ